MVDHFYKLGAAQALSNFTGWLGDSVDNPTAAPPASRYIKKTAVEKMVEKLAKKTKRRVPSPIYTPTKGTKFKAMVGKLKKRKTPRRK